LGDDRAFAGQQRNAQEGGMKSSCRPKAERLLSFTKATFAGTCINEKDAPEAVAKGLADARVILRSGLRVGGSRAMPNPSGGNREIFSLWTEPGHNAPSRKRYGL
jgi:hypothetical protein